MKRPHLDLVLEYLSEIPEAVIVDVGAHVGKLTDMFLCASENSTAIAVEPDPTSFKVLADRFKDNARVTLKQVAVAESKGMTAFYVSEKKENVGGSQSNTLYRNILKEKKHSREIPNYHKIFVLADTFENVVSEINTIHLLKLNCEGAEGFILKSPEMNKVNAIYMSQHDNPIDLLGFNLVARTWKKDHSWEFWKR